MVTSLHCSTDGLDSNIPKFTITIILQEYNMHARVCENISSRDQSILTVTHDVCVVFKSLAE